MRIARASQAGSAIWIADAGKGWQRASNPFAGKVTLGERVEEPELLAPVEPKVIVGIAQQPDNAEWPIGAWLKSARTVAPSGIDIVARRDAGRVVIEGEVAIVISRDTAGLTVENAATYVLGVTAVNDVSSPDRAVRDVRNFEAKGGEHFTPLGPWIDTEVDIENAPLTVAVDGVVKVETGSNELPASVAACLAYVTQWVPLGPGDVVMTGAPVSAFDIDPSTTASDGGKGVLVEITVAGIPLVNRFQ